MPSSLVYAEVTLSDEEMGKVVTEVEQGRKDKEIIRTLEDLDVNFDEKVGVVSGQLKECNALVEKCEQVLVEKEELFKVQMDECTKAVEDAQGSFWARLKKNVAVFGVGAFSGVVLVIVIVLVI